MADTTEQAKSSAIKKLKAWGDSPLPPTLLATLVTAQHLRPFRPLPMLFPPVLLLSSYLNLGGFQAEAAGTTAAWSALYALLAARRRQGLRNKMGARGLVRGATLAVCAVNVVGCGVAYAFGRKRGEGDRTQDVR